MLPVSGGEATERKARQIYMQREVRQMWGGSRPCPAASKGSSDAASNPLREDERGEGRGGEGRGVGRSGKEGERRGGKGREGKVR